MRRASMGVPRFLTLLIILVMLGSVQNGSVTQAIDSAGLFFEWEAPPYHLTSVLADDGRTYTRVTVEAAGYVNGGAPGAPSLPSLGRLVVLPPEGDFELELIEATYDTVPLPHPVAPAPAPAPARFDARGRPLAGGWTFVRDEAVYAGQGPHPSAFATLGAPVWMRDHRLTRLTITPFRYHPAQQTLDVLQRLRLRVRWEPSSAPRATFSGPGAFDDLLAELVLNPDDLTAFRAAPPPISLPTNRPTIIPPVLIDTARRRKWAAGSVSLSRDNQLTDPSHKIHVATEGIYGLDRATLAAAGLPVDGIDPSTLRLTYGGSEVAAQWEGDADASFESGERLLFYARPQPTRYAGYDVYWLSWGGDAGKRMAARSGDPSGLPAGVPRATALAEENLSYDSLYRGRDGDRWFWRKLKLPDRTSDTFDVTLETPTGSVPGELILWLQGDTAITAVNPDHHVRFSVNGSPVGEVWWDAKSAYTATLSVPAGNLRAGDNAVGLHLPGDTGTDIEGLWVDAIALTYGLGGVSGDVARFRGQESAGAYTVGGFSGGNLRVYDVTDPVAPRRVTGFSVAGGAVSVGDGGSAPAEYLILTDAQIQTPPVVTAAKSFADPPGGADYVIVTHPDFEAALAPLAAHRAARGLRVVTADVEAIYDRFGDGRMDPQAIRAFLAHAYLNWPGPAPRYVLLVGDGTYDPRGFKPDSNPSYLPPYLAEVDPWLGEVASDNRYADLSGDPLPELRLGRWPVNTPAQVEAIIAKVLAYESDPLPGGWNGRLLFGADNPSTAGDHHADADHQFAIYATPAYGYQGRRVYLSDVGGEAYLFTDAEAAQDALVRELNAGALLYTYFGHASWQQEAVLESDNYAPLFHQDHIGRLTNRGRWPVVLHMTCFTGRYYEASGDTLDESLLRAAEVGAVAVWGASGNGVATGHQMLNHSFFQAVFDHGQANLGAATHAALTSLYAGGQYQDLIETFHLFGDPALALDMTIVDLPFSLFLPIIQTGANP